MKKLFFFWVLILPFVFTACDSDDDDDTTTVDTSKIAGTWKASTIKPGVSTGLGSTIDNALTELVNSLIDAEFNVGGTIVLNADGTFSDNIIGLTAGTYTISSTTLTLSGSLIDTDYTFTISQLDDNYLILKMKSSYFSDILGDYYSGLGADIIFTCVRQ